MLYSGRCEKQGQQPKELELGLKTQTYPKKALAKKTADEVFALAKKCVEQRNDDDPDLNESVTLTTDETNKRYILTRPDQQDGVQVVHYCWT
jgi:hypothetical protein